MKTQTLQVRAFPLGSSPDLLDHYGVSDGFFFERDGRGVVTIGIAERLHVPASPDHVGRAAAAAEKLLSSIDGDAPIIVGALPFDGAGPSELIVPQAAIVTDSTGARLIVAGRSGMPDPENIPRDVPADPAALRSVRPVPGTQRYREAVATAVEQIRAGELDKVVLARTLEVLAEHDVHVPTLLERLRRVETGTFVFATPALIGATPELLVRREGNVLMSQPLAGTIVRGSIPDALLSEQLLASTKDREEHAFVVRAVRDALEPICSTLSVPDEPSVVATSKVLHLSTTIEGVLRAPAPSALDVAAILHPTPAVCGTPRGAALDAIAELEGFDRGLYAGLVGWMDGNGDGCWAVSLRCASIDGARARLYAGAGIVADSDPEAELAETDAKFRSIIDALGYA